MRPYRIYIDTSVVGGCQDDEFSDDSLALMEMARRGEIVLLVSDVMLEELREAPLIVRSVLETIPSASISAVGSSEVSRDLRDAYLAAKVVGPASERDAHHVALATVSGADVIVSWNFRHIVHFDKIRLFNGVNMLKGYQVIAIHSPREIVP